MGVHLLRAVMCIHRKHLYTRWQHRVKIRCQVKLSLGLYGHLYFARNPRLVGNDKETRTLYLVYRGNDSRPNQDECVPATSIGVALREFPLDLGYRGNDSAVL